MLNYNTVDIVIPVYNCETFIYDCLDSALKTSDKINANVIVALNKCSDSTPDIVGQFKDDFSMFFCAKKLKS